MMKAILLAAATACAALTQPAVAAPEPERTVHISAASYDLRTAEGRAALEAQVNRAVDAVCGKVSDPQESRKHEAFSCRRETVPNAKAQLARLFQPGVGKVTTERSSGGR
ncbi:UrcA family protein [Sphingomonas sp. DT-207]|uniref:UrcA family protein n=1 Tax=Sphingomonas sp. DT-207 TaxID=3396167 RepID=UPI003F1A6082